MSIKSAAYNQRSDFQLLHHWIHYLILETGPVASTVSRPSHSDAVVVLLCCFSGVSESLKLRPSFYSTPVFRNVTIRKTESFFDE